MPRPASLGTVNEPVIELRELRKSFGRIAAVDGLDLTIGLSTPTAGTARLFGILPFTLIAILIGQFAKPQFAQPLFMAVFFGLAILGGLWVPLQIMPSWVTDVAKAVPSYWLNHLGDLGAALRGDVMQAVLVLLAWTVALAVFISWRYRRDAARA